MAGEGSLAPSWLGALTSHEGSRHSIGADLVWSLLYVSKVLSCPVLGRVVFSSATLFTQLQWAEVFGLLFLEVGIVMIFAILQLVRVLP